MKYKMFDEYQNVIVIKYRKEKKNNIADHKTHVEDDCCKLHEEKGLR